MVVRRPRLPEKQAGTIETGPCRPDQSPARRAQEATGTTATGETAEGIVGEIGQKALR